jgi:hypothetical protein
VKAAKRTTVAALLACTALLASTERADAIEVAFELSPGVAIPIGTFVDDFPLPVADINPFLSVFAGQQPVQGAAETVGSLRVDTVNDPGFSMGVGVMLDNWTIRYNLQIHSWGKFTINGFNVQFPDGSGAEFLNNVFFDVTEPLSPIVIEDAGDDLDIASLIVHRLMFGYRFYVLDYWVIKPYIPVGLGVVFMHGDNFDQIFGGALQMGLGFEYRFDDHWALSVGFDYTASIMENPAIKDTGLVGQAIQQGTGGSGLFETAIEVFQSINIAANATYRF